MHRPVTVKYLQSITLRAQSALHFCQRLGNRLQQIATGCFITGHNASGEVVGAGVADIQGNVGGQRGDIDDACLCGRLCRRYLHLLGKRSERQQRQQQRQRFSGNRHGVGIPDRGSHS